MFAHNFKYTFLILIKNKMLIFWTFLFPIILGTFFYMAFSDIEDSEKLDIIDIAIVENDNFKSNAIFREVFENLSDEESEDQLFSIQYTNENNANKLLETDKVEGYLLFEESPKVVIKSNGINETILKYVTEELIQMEKTISNIFDSQLSKIDFSFYENIYEEIAKIQNENVINIKDISNKNLSYTMIEYYTLIAMTCLYGGILGMTAMNQILANMSSKGKRVATAAIAKKTLVLSSALSSYIIQLIGLSLLFLYTIFVLHVDYGSKFFLILILALVGSFAGLSLGIATSSILKKNETTKIGVIISLTMLGCFLSGMMGITMKYIVDKNIPLINKLNPANMITDGLYSLYYYNTLERYYLNLFSLLIFAVVMILVSIRSLRRQKYDSI